jgi:hypothetical protein
MENQVEEKVEVKSVEAETPQSPQEKEAAVLEQAVEKGEVAKEYGLQEDGVYKVNLDKPPIKEEKKEELKEEKTDAVQEPETKEEMLRDERSEVGLSGVGSEVRETPENAEEVKQEITSEENKETTESPLELIKDEEDTTDKAGVEPSTESAKPTPEPEKILQEAKTQELPEDVSKLVKFIEDTGGTVEDYAKLNRDLGKIDNITLLKEYYEFSKPHLDKEDIQFLMDKNFAYDKELDDPSDIKAKQLAFKEELFNAQQTFKKVKDQYYTDLKLRKEKDIDPKYTKALEYYNNQQQLSKEETQLKEKFLNKTNDVFNNDFKGFDFKVGENKYRFKIDNPTKTKEFQSDINNFLNQYSDDKGNLKNLNQYHKALFTAQNADKIANHFYEQGRADAIKESAKKAKNINMDPRADASSVTTSSGDTIRVVSGNSSDKLRIKWNK